MGLKRKDRGGEGEGVEQPAQQQPAQRRQGHFLGVLGCADGAAAAAVRSLAGALRPAAHNKLRGWRAPPPPPPPGGSGGGGGEVVAPARRRRKFALQPGQAPPAAMLTMMGYVVSAAEVERAYGTGTVRAIVNALTVQPVHPGGVSRLGKTFEVFHVSPPGPDRKLILPRHFAAEAGLPAPTHRFLPRQAGDDAALAARLSFAGSLRANQEEPFALTLARLDAHGCGVLSLPTGDGKTAMALRVACHYGRRTLVVVNKDNLMDQWQERIRQFVPRARVGRIQGSVVEDGDIVVAMIHSVSMSKYAFEVFAGFGLTVVDECHHIAAETFSRCMLKATAPLTLGLTATPDRNDGLGHVIEWFLGPVFYRRVPSFGPVRVRVVACAGPGDEYELPRINNGTVNMNRVVEDIVGDAARNELVAEVVARILLGDARRNVIVLSQRVKHCSVLADLIRARLEAAGADAAAAVVGLLTGKTSKADRAQTITECRTIVGTYSFAGEGLDITRLNALVMASPMKSIEQVVGRIMRSKDDGVERLIVDFRDPIIPLVVQFRHRKTFYEATGFAVESVKNIAHW